MEYWNRIDAFLRSKPALESWPKFHAVFFWVSLPVTAIALWLFISVVIKYEKRKKQLQTRLHSPGMEDVRHLLKPFLKEHGIRADDKYHEKN